MTKEEYDNELRKAHNEILKNEVECTIADGRTEREKYLEQRCEELESRIRKMKIGDYVRTKKDGIGKIIKTEPFMNDIHIFLDSEKGDITFQTKNRVCKVCNEESIIKSSPNILKLLEPMDLLYIDISPDDCGGIVVHRIPETLDELNGFVEFIKSGHWILKYVVTHEQLENNMYEVGD